jgi:hypothetical protein
MTNDYGRHQQQQQTNEIGRNTMGRTLSGSYTAEGSNRFLPSSDRGDDDDRWLSEYRDREGSREKEIEFVRGDGMTRDEPELNEKALRRLGVEGPR